MIAFPPSDAPHLWHSNVSKLASQLGMPVGSTGGDIVAFVMHVAERKNELGRVSELIKSMACTAKAIERQAVVSSMLASTIPNASSSAPLEGNVSSVDSSQARKRVYDEISSASDPGDREELESSSYSSSDDNDDRAKEIASRPPRHSKYSEEDLYCRIAGCLWAFDQPRTCMKHRQRHFPEQWPCPGPCTEKEGKFARDETLKRHLLHPRYAACQEVVLERLGLKLIPVLGSHWLAPLRDGPDRPWESPDFQLTDLKTVKEMKKNALDLTKAPLPLAENPRRRRYK